MVRREQDSPHGKVQTSSPERSHAVRVLITGASGFIGRHMVPHLLSLGHEVEAWGRQELPSRSGLTRRVLDLSKDPLPSPSATAPWDAAIHLAAHARPSLAWSVDLVIENLRLTARVLQHVADQAPGCRTILASSAHVYAPSTSPHRESDPVDPKAFYGLSKRLCEDWAVSMTNRLDLQVVRAFNQIGPGMPKGLLLPDLLAKLSTPGPTLTMEGRNDTKDFLDIRDAVLAYEALLTVTAPSGSIWNLCSGTPISVAEFIQAVLSLRGLDRAVEFSSHESHRIVGDPSRIQDATGWKPQHDLKESLAYAMEERHG